MQSMPSGRLPLVQLAWCQLKDDKASSAGVGLAILLTLLPGGSLFPESLALHMRPAGKVVAGALVLLSVMLAGLSGRWYIETRLRTLALLRARGWSQPQVQHLVLVQFAMLGTLATGVALIGLSILIWRPEVASTTHAAAYPHWNVRLMVAAAMVVPPTLAATALLRLARWTSRQNVSRLNQPVLSPFRLLRWRSTDLHGLLILPAALLLLLLRSTGTEHDDTVAVVVSLAALIMLAIASLELMSSVTEALSRRLIDLEGTLARWQLRRWWHRHAAAGFLMVFTIAIALFAAVSLAHDALDGWALGSSHPSLNVSFSLASGLAGCIVVVFLIYGLLFRFACRSRADDYEALVLDGLPVDAIRRCLAVEQRMVLTISLLVGLGLGLALLWANASAIGPEDGGLPIAGILSVATVIGVLSTTVIVLLVGEAVVRMMGRSVIGLHFLQGLRPIK